MSQTVPRRERREIERQHRQQRHRPPAPRRTRRRTGLWIGLGVVTAFALLIIAARAAGVFEPGAPPIDVRDAKYDPGNEVIGEHLPDEGNAHIPPGQKGSYQTIPPTSGSHWGAPAAPAPWGIKEAKLADEVTTHNLEHGGIIISYKALIQEDVAKLKDLVRVLGTAGYTKIVLQPYPEMNDARIAVTAWRWMLKLPTYDDVPIVKFVRAHYAGPDAPERGAR